MLEPLAAHLFEGCQFLFQLVQPLVNRVAAWLRGIQDNTALFQQCLYEHIGITYDRVCNASVEGTVEAQNCGHQLSCGKRRDYVGEIVNQEFSEMLNLLDDFTGREASCGSGSRR